MTAPTVPALAGWLGADLLAALDKRRKTRQEYCRQRKLATIQTLWLMIAVSLNTARRSIDEILRLAIVDLEVDWKVSVSAFCQARGRFSLDSLLWLLGRLVRDLNRQSSSQRWRGLRLLAIDHTTLTLPESTPLWKRFKSHRGKKGLGPVAVEFACVFHLFSQAPFFYTIAKAATSDHKLIKRLIRRLRKADLILIDNGFYYLQTFLKIRKRGAHFLIPARTSHRPKVIKTLGGGDYLCRIISGEQSLIVRVIYIERKGFRRRRLVTSLLEPSAFPSADFSQLYHLRWGVETFYRDFKHTLQATHWHCRTPAAFERELAVHLITVCLVRKIMLEAALKARVQVRELSFARSLTEARVFFRRLCRLTDHRQLYVQLVDICVTLRIVIKPGRRFSRDRQEYRRNARGIKPKRRGATLPAASASDPGRQVRSDNHLLP